MQSDARRENFTSLVGTVPLADVLADLPLPTPLPTPLEETVLGTKGLSNESRKLLDSTNPVLCSRIAEALLAVDTSFLNLKDSAQTVPYTPSMKDPPLIRAVMTSLLPQAVVKVQKLDPGLYRGPVINSPSSSMPDIQASADAVVPVHAAPGGTLLKPPPGKRRDKKKSSTEDFPLATKGSEPKGRRKTRRISSSSDESPPPKRKRQKFTEYDQSSSAEALHVSIGHRSNQFDQPESPKPKRRQKAKPRQQAPSIPSPLPVHFPRAKLKGYFGLPYSGEVHVLQTSEAFGPVSRTDVVTMAMGGEGWTQQDMEFAMAPGVTDQEIPKERKKKKKKHSHQRGDQTKLANLKRFSTMIFGLFDQQMSEEDLFNRMTVSEILSQVTTLKQQGCLHEVPVDSLIQLIGLMDRHVLDSANLLINSAPEGMEGDTKVWRDVARDRILRSADSALVILHIITAPDMPKKVHLEESVDQVLALTKFHLDNNVYPQFDPVYKAEKKESGMLPRQKRRGGGGGQAANKIVNAIYHKLTEVVDTMAILTETQPLTDTIVLMLSSMGTLPFFVENVALLQLSALRLVRAIFTRYDKHRDLILEELFASLRRLPTNKRNLRSFKLSNGQHIQMLTALVLQLVQCTVVPPKPTQDKEQKSVTPTEGTKDEIDKKPDMDTQMTNTYNFALATGKNFLAKFLKKCSGGKDEDDFRPLFDNFIQDLLTTLNLPMWPASEVLLTLLGMLLVQSFSNRSTEQSVRLMSLDHLGVIAARLRKDVTTPASETENEELVDILAQVMQSKLERGTPSPTMLAPLDALTENNQHLQKALIAYLNKQSESDPACAYARDFYIGQWLYDIHLELERVLKENPTSPTAGLNFEHFSEAFEEAGAGLSSSGIALQQSELKKTLILSFLDSKKLSSFKQLESILDERLAAVVTRHLATSRALTKSFDMYLQKLILVSNEPAVHVRTRAMKALSSIVAADPGILSRPDMQQAVGFRLSDTSTLVREAAVDLIGRFVLSRPDLTSKYYDMIAERIRDSGVSVRKRVIKIMKDICVMQPDFPKINDICVRIIRRISDEEAIKQLVSSVFSELWFAPLPEGPHKKELLLRRVTNITAVVETCKEYEWFEQLLEQILKNEDQVATQAVLNVCQMMVDCLVENVLSLDENSAKSCSSTSSLMPCVITLYLFCNVKPALLLSHATTLHPYLSSVCAANKDVMVLHFVSKILKEVVPLMQHPSQAFLAGLEEDLVKLIMKQGQFLIHSAVECLSAVVNNVSHNYNLVKDCFQRFYKCLEHMRALQTHNPTNPQLKTLRISLLRSVFTVGVLCKFFDIDNIIPSAPGSELMSKKVYSYLIYFFKHGDEEIQVKTVKGLGFFCIRYPDMMLHAEMRQLINDWLTSDCASTKKVEVLRNLHSYLKEVEMQLKAADTKWDKEGTDRDNLQEFGDHHSSVSSNIAQAFLMPILESFFHTELQVRLGALQATLLILRQGLVHPAQCVPYLVAMSTDPDQTIKVKADQHLTEHTSRYGHLMQTQLLGGVRKSYEFQKLIVGDGARAYSTDNVGNSSSLLSHIYILARSNKQHRRVLLRALLRHFEDYEKNSLGLLLYLADTLAYLPYNTMEEPLFVIHHVDMTISIVGSNLLQQFKEVMGRGLSGAAEDIDVATLSEENCDLQQLSDCCHSCQGCFLLLLLKQHLKKSFSLSDSKCQKYSPTEVNKANDKVMTNRKGGLVFDPQQVVAMVKQDAMSARKLLLSREECIRHYLEFKQLMDKLDPFEGDDDGSDQEAPPPTSTMTNLPEIVQPQQEKGGDVPPALAAPVAGLMVAAAPPRARSHGHSSRASSTSSINSRKGKKASKPKKKKKRVIISSGSSADEGDREWT